MTSSGGSDCDRMLSSAAPIWAARLYVGTITATDGLDIETFPSRLIDKERSMAVVAQQ